MTSRLLEASAVNGESCARSAGFDDQLISVSGAQFLRNGERWYPHGFNCRGLLAPQWYSDGGGPSDISRARFLPATRDLWRAKGADCLRWQISQVGVMDPALTAVQRQDYIDYIVDGINLVRSEGFPCIVSCQDQSGGGGPGASTPSDRTTTFWEIVAPLFAQDQGVIYDIFNEPQTGTGQQVQWRDGGGLNNLGETRVGHQDLLDTIRLYANNVILAEGGSFAQTLEGTTALVDPLNNYAYSIHPYNYDTLGSEAAWLTPYTVAPATAPIIATEWQFPTGAGHCGGTEESLAPTLLKFLRRYNVGVLGHAGDTDALIANFTTGRPTQCLTADPGCGAIFMAWLIPDSAILSDGVYAAPLAVSGTNAARLTNTGTYTSRPAATAQNISPYITVGAYG